MNKLRQLLVEKIKSNGGYYSRPEHFPLSWRVYLTPNLSIEHLCALNGDERAIPQFIIDERDENHEWEISQEDLAGHLIDGHGYISQSQEDAIRWGFPFYSAPKLLKDRYARIEKSDVCFYPAQLKGWKRVQPFNNLNFQVEFGLRGRGGTQVVVRRFEGVPIDGDLIDRIADAGPSHWGVSNFWVRKLLMMIDFWDREFTTRKANDEAEYLAAQRLSDQITEYYKEKKERDYWSQRDVVTLVA